MNAKLSCLGLLTAVVLLASASQANATRVVGAWETPVVTDTVTQIDASSWQYSFTITNMSWSLNNTGNAAYTIALADAMRITDYRLPYFSDASITSIQAPTGWTWAIDAVDSFSLGYGAQTLHWYATSVTYGIAGALTDSEPYPLSSSGDTLGGFSFVAGYSPVKAPFISTFYNSYSITGDPALPGSPAALGAGLTSPLPVTGVSEPKTYAMIIAGLGLMGFMARRCKNGQA